MHSTSKSASSLRIATFSAPASKDPLASTWRTRSGCSARTAAHRLDHPTGLDLQPHPGRAVLHHGVDLPAQHGECRGRRGSPRRRRPPGPRNPRPPRDRRPASARRPAARRRRPPSRSVAASIRSTGRPAEELGHARRSGKLTAPGRGRFVQAGHAQLHRRPLHRRQGRIDGGAVLQGGTLAPALAVLGDDPDEEQRTQPVHAGGGADGLTEREVDLDQFHAGEPHDAGAPTPSP